MHVIISNYGNDSIALIQWASLAKLPHVHVLYVDTGWAAPSWKERTSSGEKWATSLGFITHTLKPAADFATLMRTRGSFPTRKFQWCAGFLKGLPINDWLQTHDSAGKSTIMLGRRRAASRAQFNLPEYIEESEHFADRKVWHPLYLHSFEARNVLIQQAGFPMVSHRSLECDPCVNSDAHDVRRMDASVIERASELETTLNATMLDSELYQQQPNLKAAFPILKTASHHASQELFDMGCGSPFGCGL